MQEIPEVQVLLVQQEILVLMALVLRAVAPETLAVQVQLVLMEIRARLVVGQPLATPVTQVGLAQLVQQVQQEQMVLVQLPAAQETPEPLVMLVLTLQLQLMQIQRQINRIAQHWRTLWGRVPKPEHFHSIG
jgi:hypothetical protein